MGSRSRHAVKGCDVAQRAASSKISRWGLDIMCNIEINVKCCGAVGDGSHDDTAAFQQAINAGLEHGGKVVIPPGEYIISESLVCAFRSSYGNGFEFTGVGGGWSNGAKLHWRGSNAASPVLDCVGLNWSVFRDFKIARSSESHPYIGAIHIRTELATNPLTGSSSTKLQNLTIDGGIGAGSYGIKIGDDSGDNWSNQCSEILVERVTTQCRGVTDFGYWIAGSGNTKDTTFLFSQCTFAKEAAFKWMIASGWHNVISPGGGGNKRDFWVQGNGHIRIQCGGSEGSNIVAQFDGAGMNNHGSFSMSSYVAEDVKTIDGAFVIFGDVLATLDCNSFYSSEELFQIVLSHSFTNIAGRASALSSRGNYYANASGILPISLGSASAKILMDDTLGYSYFVSSHHDIGGVNGGELERLHNLEWIVSA